jgi:hypothetical protein
MTAVKRAFISVAVALGVLVGGFAMAAPASALGPNQCNAPAWNFNSVFSDGTVAQSCGPGTTVKYRLGCVLGNKTVTVYFGVNGSSRVTNLPACQLGYTGWSWSVA